MCKGKSYRHLEENNITGGVATQEIWEELCGATKKGGLLYATVNQKDLWDGDLVVIYFDGNANMEKFYWRRRHDKGKKISNFRWRLIFCFLW